MKFLLKLIIVAVGISVASTASSCNGSTSSVSDSQTASDSSVTAQAGVNGKQEKLPDYRVYGLQKPARMVRQWAISEEELANLSGYNPTNYRSVDKALQDGALDEMSTSIRTAKFSANGSIADEYDDPVFPFLVEDVPPFFTVKYENGLPSNFTLDEKAMQKWLEDGGFLDMYDMALKSFSITYDEKGLPVKLSGKGLGGFFSDAPYNLVYRDYKFDDKGNWIRRTVETPSVTFVQFRNYEY